MLDRYLALLLLALVLMLLSFSTLAQNSDSLRTLFLLMYRLNGCTG